MGKYMTRSTCFQRSTVVSALLLVSMNAAFAQESAYADLNACTKNEQIKSTAKGAAIGALSGLGAAFLSGKKDNAGKAAFAGALVGGGVGFATAYYSAIDTCYKLNPSWMPESKLVRDPSKTYQQVNKENHYQPKEGVKVLVKQFDVAPTVKPGAKLPLNGTFDLMTPNGAETAVMIDRKLFVVEDGKETALPFPSGDKAQNGQSTVVEAGRNVSNVQLPIGEDAKPGTVYRVDFSVAAAGKTPDVVSRSFTVQ
jgi:hypothetical protein